MLAFSTEVISIKNSILNVVFLDLNLPRLKWHGLLDGVEK
jgi:hypothetical protein